MCEGKFINGKGFEMEERDFRNAMRKFTTGVTAILTDNDYSYHGMTANAFMSVSMQPCLICVSLDHSSNTLQEIKVTEYFSVNILSEDQLDIAMHFAGQQEKEDKVHIGMMNGIPVIQESLASVVCSLYQLNYVGDHTLCIGEVIDVRSMDGNPLMYYESGYVKQELREYK